MFHFTIIIMNKNCVPLQDKMMISFTPHINEPVKLTVIRSRTCGSCLLWVMSTEISVDIAVDIAVDSRSIVGR